MAQLNADRVRVLFDDGAAPRTTVYEVRNCSSGDTIDVSNRFAIVDVAAAVASGSTVVTAIAQTTAPATLAIGTALTTGATAIVTVRGPASTGVIA